MKNTIILFFALLMMMSCTRQSVIEEPVDQWNGYSHFLKECTVDHTLWAHAAKNDTTLGAKVGDVSYNLEPNANGIPCLHVQYTCIDGWVMTETHVYAGLLKDMPLNNAKDGMLGNPKVGKFPQSAILGSQGASTWDCWFILSELPPYVYTGEEGQDQLMINYGFAVASHCVVRSSSGQVETAWAYGSDKFNDKGWGWYDKYYEPIGKQPFTVLYGTAYSQDSLELYHLNITTGVTTLLLKEYVGDAAGTYDGTAYDEQSGLFFFVNFDTRELWVNQMGDADPSMSAGTLNGTAKSGTFYNNTYYYVNPDFNTINMVTFDADWLISNETVLDTIPNAIIVNDIAMSPSGDYLYLVGEVNGGTTEMIKYSMAGDVYYTIALAITNGAQIAYGSDGNLYAIAPAVEGGSSSVAYTVNTETGVLTEIDEGRIIIVPDAFTDISTGAIM